MTVEERVLQRQMDEITYLRALVHRIENSEPLVETDRQTVVQAINMMIRQKKIGYENTKRYYMEER